MLSSDGMRIWLHPWLLSSLLHTYIYTYQHTYHWCLDIAPTQRKDFSNSREKKEKKKDGCEKLKNDYLSRLRIYISVYIYMCISGVLGKNWHKKGKRSTQPFEATFFFKKDQQKQDPPASKKAICAWSTWPCFKTIWRASKSYVCGDINGRFWQCSVEHMMGFLQKINYIIDSCTLKRKMVSFSRDLLKWFHEYIL